MAGWMALRLQHGRFPNTSPTRGAKAVESMGLPCRDYDLIKLFHFFIEESFLEHIATETNRYGNVDWVKKCDEDDDASFDDSVDGSGGASVGGSVGGSVDGAVDASVDASVAASVVQRRSSLRGISLLPADRTTRSSRLHPTQLQ